MKASELRIGNLLVEQGIDYNPDGIKFHDPEGDEILQVISINEDEFDCKLFGKNGQYLTCIPFDDEGYICPIPLTEEWLEKFGFEIKEERSKDRYWKGDFLYMDGHLFIHFSVNEGDYAIPCQYVHQLQNLYHALTGEELTIKE